jgi:hypothetical protein
LALKMENGFVAIPLALANAGKLTVVFDPAMK